MTETPETDAAIYPITGVDIVWPEFARKLERERDAAIAERDELRRMNKELQLTFDLRWKADQRAIGRWQNAHAGRELTWPDRADMVVWLLENHNQPK